MPFLGIGLHIVIALFFAVHAIRTGQNYYWLFILFSFPLLGSIVYAFAIYFPGSRLERKAFKQVRSLANKLDPNKELRAAQDAYDQVASVQNLMRMAAALFEAGQFEQSADTYQKCLSGLFATDPEVRFQAARACIECRRYAKAQEHLVSMDQAYTSRAQEVMLLNARAFAGLGQHDQAKALFENAVAQYNTFEARAEYAIWAYSQQDFALAERLNSEIAPLIKRWNSTNKELNESLLTRWQAAKKTQQLPKTNA